MWIGFGLAIFALVSSALLAYLGYGLAKLLLPREWRSAEGYLTPLLGYVLLLLVSYYAVRTVLNLIGALFLVLAIATVLNGLALWRRRGESLALELREHGLAWLIAALAFLLAVLPLLSYGYSTPIGENWDPENYLPVTEYLVQVPVNRIGEMPPNPLRDLNANPPRIGLTLGFSILQGILEQLPGWDARASFAPTIALLYALTALALYGLFRQGFGMSRWAGTIAALFGGLYALALWVAFFNFGMQMAGLPLVPLALTLWLAVLRQPSWRTVLLAAAAIAALPAAYYPAITVFVPMALGLGLYELVRAPRHGLVLLAGFGTALLAVGLAVGTILDYREGFAFRYSQQLTTLGLFHFPPLAQVLGLAPFVRTPEALPVLWGDIVPGAIFLVLLVAWAVLGPRPQNWLCLAALIPGLFYLAWLRGWFWPAAVSLQQRGLLPLGTGQLDLLKPYPYAYLKGTVFVVPLLWSLAVACWERLLHWLSRWPGTRIWRIGLASLLLLPLGLALVADGQVVARYWGRPAHFDQEALQVEEGVRLLPKGAPVYLSGRPGRSWVLLGLFSYFLREHPVQGRISTAYAGFDHRLPGAEPSYALLDADDSPYPLGFFPDEKVWAGGGMVLYRRDPAVLSFLDLREEAYLNRLGDEIHSNEPLLERLASGFGGCSGVSAGHSTVFEADAARLSRTGQELAGASGTRALAISFAAALPATVEVRWGDGTSEEWSLPAGFSVVHSQPHGMPARVEISSPTLNPLGACWAALLPEAGTARVQGYPEVVLAWPEVTTEDSGLRVVLWSYNGSARPLRLALEVWENTFQDAQHYAWWGPILLPDGAASIFISANMADRVAGAALLTGGMLSLPFPAHPGAETWPEVTDGSYFASLWLYYGSQVVEVLPIGKFNLQGGQVQYLAWLDPGQSLVWPHSPGTPSGARFGPAIELAAYERASGPFHPGDNVPVALEWHALAKVPLNYSVSVQIQSPGLLRGQWDGPIGQWYPATSWQAGQSVRDDIPLQVAASAPPGRYRLAVIVYDPSTGQRLPVRSADGQNLGDSLDLGEIVVR